MYVFQILLLSNWLHWFLPESHSFLQMFLEVSSNDKKKMFIISTVSSKWGRFLAILEIHFWNELWLNECRRTHILVHVFSQLAREVVCPHQSRSKSIIRWTHFELVSVSRCTRNQKQYWFLNYLPLVSNDSRACSFIFFILYLIQIIFIR